MTVQRKINQMRSFEDNERDLNPRPMVEAAVVVTVGKGLVLVVVLVVAVVVREGRGLDVRRVVVGRVVRVCAVLVVFVRGFLTQRVRLHKVFG